jgi:hypothetical protein
MAYAQSTLEEIVDSERSMILDASARYGRHYKHARAATMYLTLCIVGMDHDRSDTLGRLLSLMKKHHMLAFLSALRLHKVQAMMDLRHVLEAGAAAAYAILNPDIHDFVEVDPFGIMDPSQKLTRNRYGWLNENYPDKSKWISETKDRINNQTAHANIISADSTFRMEDGDGRAATSFFDIEDEYFAKADLWLISSAAITLMDLFYGVANGVAQATGRSVVEFRADFLCAVRGLAIESNSLVEELKASDRFKAAMRKEEHRAEARADSEGRG